MPDLRRMTAADLEAVARLHVLSWRYAYADILSPEFLDGPVDVDRSALWARRIHALDTPAAFGWVAEETRGLLGFAYVIVGADPVHGNLLDNLHVAPDRHGSGLGRLLLGAVGKELTRRSASGGMYLWVYASNVRAQGFYTRCGASRVEAAEQTSAEGRRLEAFRYSWPSVQALLAGVTRSGEQDRGP